MAKINKQAIGKTFKKDGKPLLEALEGMKEELKDDKGPLACARDRWGSLGIPRHAPCTCHIPSVGCSHMPLAAPSYAEPIANHSGIRLCVLHCSQVQAMQSWWL